MADKSDVKVWEKSRRIGASWTEACDCALTASSTQGMDAFYTSYDKEMTRQFIEDVAEWSKLYNLAASAVEEDVFQDEDKDIQVFRIHYNSGHRIEALSSAPRNLRSKQGIAVIDEAAFLDNLAQVLKAAIAFLMWGGKVRIISTHNGDLHPFNELIQDVRAGKKPYSPHRTTLDDALAQGLYQRICRRVGKTWSREAELAWRQAMMDFYGEDADEELFCIPRASGGRYLSRLLIEACMDESMPVIRWSQDDAFTLAPRAEREYRTYEFCEEKLLPILQAMPNLPVFIGEDFGRSGNLTVIQPLIQLPNLRLQAPFTLELFNVPHEQQAQIFFFIADNLRRFYGAALDARGNGSYLAEVMQQRYGHIVQAVMLSSPWYIENMPKLKAAIEDRDLLLPRDAEILADYRAIELVKGVPKVPDRASDDEGAVRKKGKMKRHGDAAIAGALAVFAARSEAGGPVRVASRRRREACALVEGY